MCVSDMIRQWSGSDVRELYAVDTVKSTTLSKLAPQRVRRLLSNKATLLGVDGGDGAILLQGCPPATPQMHYRAFGAHISDLSVEGQS